MFCAKCGARLEDGKKFCGDCGAKVADDVLQAAAPAATAPARSAVLPIVVVIAVVCAVVGVLVYKGGVGNVAGAAGKATSAWKGYRDFDSFSRAIDADELLGRKMTEEAFQALVVLGFLFSSEIQVEIVSGNKLTERYKVPESLRKDYNYLAKGSDITDSKNRCAFFLDDEWVVLSW